MGFLNFLMIYTQLCNKKLENCKQTLIFKLNVLLNTQLSERKFSYEISLFWENGVMEVAMDSAFDYTSPNKFCVKHNLSCVKHILNLSYKERNPLFSRT